jgi:Xaa-Pro aminopeptidase
MAHETPQASPLSPDAMVLNDDWSDLSKYKELPEIDLDRLHAYRTKRLKDEMNRQEVALLILVSPITLRYAVNYSTYPHFQSHIPSTYVFLPSEGPTVIYGAYGDPMGCDDKRTARPLSFWDGATELNEASRQFADDVVRFLDECGTTNRKVAIEYVNPSITLALSQRGIEVVDGVLISEPARTVKNTDEIKCIRWSLAVAELGLTKVKEAIRPGVSEVQLWGLLNYTNLANHGQWHEGRMLASGPRINPWLQEATKRKVESGDLVGLDTDMVGPMGYFADISRTFHCGPTKPTARQKLLYRLAVEEIEYNMPLFKPGITFHELQRDFKVMPDEFLEQAYNCPIHGVGLCDEYPQITPIHRGVNRYDGLIEAGMVICVESYVGAVGERDGVKLEQQILITENGFELMTQYPWEEELLN